MSSERTEADIAFIRALAEILNDNGLGEIEVSREDGEDREFTVRIARNAPQVAAPVAVPAAAPAPSPMPPPAAETPVASGSDAPRSDDTDIVPSPMVGTAYLASEPGAAPFVNVGDTVTEGQTILIVEAMKTMNQIPSPRAGVVREILVEDSEPVEYGSPLMKIA